MPDDGPESVGLGLYLTVERFEFYLFCAQPNPAQLLRPMLAKMPWWSSLGQSKLGVLAGELVLSAKLGPAIAPASHHTP